MLYLILIASAIFAGYGRYRDIMSSRNFLYYGGKEANPINKDEFGLFKSKFNIIGSIALIVGLLLSGFIFSNWIMGAIGGLLIFAIPSLVIGINNDKENKYSRENIQKPILRHIRDTGNVPTIETGNVGAGGSMALQEFPIGNPTRRFYRPFAWIYSNKTTKEEAKIDINSRLIELANKPEAEWFPR